MEAGIWRWIVGFHLENGDESEGAHFTENKNKEDAPLDDD